MIEQQCLREGNLRAWMPRCQALRHGHPRTGGLSRTCRMRRAGTLVEMLVAMLLSLFVGTTLLMLVQSTMSARTSVQDGNGAIRDTRDALDAVENALRNAQMVTGQGVLSAASSNSITCYTNTAGTTTTRYWLDTSVTPNVFKKTVAGVTTSVLSDVTALTFTYYVSSGTNFTSVSSLWTTTTSATSPTATERANLGAVAITVTVTSGGVSRTLTTFVRLRNSPTKTHV